MRNRLSLVPLLYFVLVNPSINAPVSAAPTPDEYRKLADEAEAALRHDVLGVWFPRCVNEQRGGFDSSFDRQWRKKGESDPFIVFQARMTWISATVAKRRPDLHDQYLKNARHGFQFLKQHMTDAQDGGMFWELDRDLKPKGDGTKHAYGISFGIYASAAEYDATGDQVAFDLALKTFRWFDDHAHDAKNGGYFETLARDGAPLHLGTLDSPDPPMFVPGSFPVAYKSMNSHIHLLEAFTELYRVSKDERVKQRLEETLHVVRDKIAVEPGCLNLFFTPDWRAVPDYDSFGHDIETAFLMLEAAEQLGIPQDPRTRKVSKQIVDHALKWGWDEQYGGFYDKGAALERAHDLRKTWWVQFEGLNALLIMHEHFGREDEKYWDAFVKQWRFIQDHQRDKEFGGYYAGVERDGTVKDFGKAQQWKAAYHDGRALLTTADRLRALAR